MKINKVKMQIGECIVELEGECEVEENKFDQMSISAYNHVVIMSKEFMKISKEFQKDEISDDCEDDNEHCSIKNKESQITAKVDSTNMFV